MTTMLCFLSLILCLIVKARAKPSASAVLLNQDDILDGLKQTLRGLDKLVSFFEGHVGEVNLDGIYGLRVAEGALKDSLTEHSEAFWNGMPEAEGENIRKQLVELSQRTSSVSNHAQSSIKKQSLSYFNKFKAVVDKPWHFFVKFGAHKLPLFQATTSHEGKEQMENKWDEKLSDQCMSEALGSNDKHMKCLFSERCIGAVTNARQKNYGLTHHILFFTLSLINNCEKKYSAILFPRFGVDVNDLIQQRCSAIMAEMVALEKKGIPVDQEDLYLEQGFVCGMHGFEEFMSLKRVKNVLSRQRSRFGCFGNDTNDVHMDEEGHRRSSRDNGGLRGNPESYRSMRRLLVDVTLDHGCSSHESGVAAGYLGLYTKWLLTKLDTSSLAPTQPSTIRITSRELQLSVSTQEIRCKRTLARGVKDNKMSSLPLAVLVSFLTTILTLAIVYVLYKLKLCRYRDQNGNHEYKKVKTRSNIM